MVAGTHLSLPMALVSSFVYFAGARYLHIPDANVASPLSRAAIKKYVLANNKSLANSNNVFDAQFNKAIRSGVEKGEFAQPKGKLFRSQFLALAALLHLHVLA